MARPVCCARSGGSALSRRNRRPVSMRHPAYTASLRENLIGVAAIVASNFVFLVNDTMLKLVSVRLPLGEIIFLRGALATLLMSVLLARYRLYAQIAGLVAWPVFWRTAGELAGAYLYIIALFHMPIANINAILQAVP